MDRINEIQARLAEINAAIDTATGDDLTALETESRDLLEEMTTLQETAQARQQLRQQIAEGAGTPIPSGPEPAKATAEERAAKKFAQTKRMTIGVDQARSVLISSGKLAQPTEVSGINEIPGAKVSSIIDLVKVVNGQGMGTYRVAYVDSDPAAAATQTEGSAATTASLVDFKYVDIMPTSVAVLDFISKQAKKQTPLLYSAKVREKALLALRKKAASIVTTALKGSTLNATVDAALSTGSNKTGVIDEKTLRRLAMSYGGDESIIGGAVLFLNKIDLLAFGDVRGTNEKESVYDITPDTANPNTGIIKDGSLSVRYCIDNELTVCAGTAQSASDPIPTMLYGAPGCLELVLFSDYEVSVSEDFAFDKLLDAVRGDVELGAGVTVKNGFVAYTIPKSGS